MELTNPQIAIIGIVVVLITMKILNISTNMMLIFGGVAVATYLFATQTDAGKKLLAKATGKA